MVRSGLSCWRTCLDGLQQLRQSFEREELALQRHENGVRRRHRVDGQQIERRRTVDQHVAEITRARRRRVQGRERAAQAEGAVARLRDLKLEAGEIERRRRKMEARHRGRHDRVAQRRLADEDVVGGVAAVAAIDAETGRSVALRIEIDDQDVARRSRRARCRG